MLDTKQMAALHRLVQVDGLVQNYRVEIVRDLLTAMPETACDVPEIVRQAVELVAPGTGWGDDAVALVEACHADRDNVGHARSLLDVMVMVAEAKPTARRRRRAQPEHDAIRVIGS
jgi:hypothetical protein